MLLSEFTDMMTKYNQMQMDYQEQHKNHIRQSFLLPSKHINKQTNKKNITNPELAIMSHKQAIHRDIREDGDRGRARGRRGQGTDGC